jgi:DNA-binding transcriptional MerR regulator
VPELKTAVREITYSLGAVSRLTGLSPELLRAWERRYGVVEPLRTAGGTRRYRAADLDRLRLLKAAVDVGHRIGQVHGLGDEELGRLVEAPEPGRDERLGPVFAALRVLDGAEAQRLLALRLSALGGARFAREIALPLVREIGERWASDRLGIASEHLASAVLRSMLGSALQPGAAALRGVRIVLGTLAGERHELGLLMAALVAMGAGANPVYLGPDLPVDDLLEAVERSAAAALGLSVVTRPTAHTTRAMTALRGGLPDEVLVWVGGSGAEELELPEGVERIRSLEQLEQRVARLEFEAVARR